MLVRFFVNEVLELLNTTVIWRIGSAIGDHVLMTGAVREVYSQQKSRIVVITNYPVFFRNNKYVRLLLTIEANRKYTKWVIPFFHYIGGKRFLNFCVKTSSIEFLDHMREIRFNGHISMLHILHWSIKKNFKSLVPELFFSEADFFEFSRKLSLPDDYCVVCPHSKTSLTTVKSWHRGGFASVISETRSLNWIQVGGEVEASLPNIRFNLSGKLSLYELIILLANSRYVLTTEGLINHIAAAFPSVKTFLIHSGFSHYQYVEYANTIILKASAIPSCAPCWKKECNLSEKVCTTRLRASDVVERILSVAKSDQLI